MKRIILASIAAVSMMLLPQSAKAQAEELKVMSYNIRLGTGRYEFVEIPCACNLGNAEGSGS